MSKIKAVTKDKKLIIVSRPILTSGSRNIDELFVVFDKTWNFDSAEYYVNFFISDDKNGVIKHLDVSGNVGRCEIPLYITETDGLFSFGVFAKADGDIIKTSDIVGYEVKKGICIEPVGSEHFTAAEIKKMFIDMINRKIYCSGLSYDMRFETIELNFGLYIDRFSEDMVEVGDLADEFYNVISEFIDPDIQRVSGAKEALAAYCFALSEYFGGESNPQFALDSVNDRLQELNDFSDNILNLITTYIDDDFTGENDLIMYALTMEEHLMNAAETAECFNAVVSDLYSFYTGGNE